VCERASEWVSEWPHMFYSTVPEADVARYVLTHTHTHQIYIYAYTYTHVYIYKHTYMYVHIHTHVYILGIYSICFITRWQKLMWRVCTYTHTHTHARTRVYMYAHTPLYMCMRTHVNTIA